MPPPRSGSPTVSTCWNTAAPCAKAPRRRSPATSISSRFISGCSRAELPSNAAAAAAEAHPALRAHCEERIDAAIQFFASGEQPGLPGRKGSWHLRLKACVTYALHLARIEVEAAIDARAVLGMAEGASLGVALPGRAKRRVHGVVERRFYTSCAEDDADVVAAGAVDGVPKCTDFIRRHPVL